MPTNGITTNLLSQIASSPSTANQFVTDLNQVAQDLQGGNLGTAQADFVTLSQNALNGATSATAPTSGFSPSLLTAIAGNSTSETPFVNELNQLGTDLQNGNLSSSLEDMLALELTAVNAASTNSTATPAPAAAPATNNTSTASELISAVVSALGNGDNSTAGVAISALASVSTSSAGASYLQAVSEGLSASSSNGSTSSMTQLLQSLDSSNQNSSASLLNLLA